MCRRQNCGFPRKDALHCEMRWPGQVRPRRTARFFGVGTAPQEATAIPSALDGPGLRGPQPAIATKALDQGDGEVTTPTGRAGRPFFEGLPRVGHNTESSLMIDTTKRPPLRSFQPCGPRLLLTIKGNRTTSLLFGTRRSRNVMLPQLSRAKQFGLRLCNPCICRSYRARRLDYARRKMMRRP